MNNLDLFYSRMIDSLKLLLVPFENLHKYLPDYVDVPFELIDTYHEAFILLPQLIEKEYFDFKTIANMMRLEDLLQFINNIPEYEKITTEQFLSTKEWGKIKELAKEILIQLKEPLDNPDLGYITYVK